MITAVSNVNLVLAKLQYSLPAAQFDALKTKAAALLAEVALTWSIHAAADLAVLRPPNTREDIYKRLETWRKVSDHYRTVEAHLPMLVNSVEMKTASKLVDLFQRLGMVLTTARNAMPTWAVDMGLHKG